jgi:predicted transcriptional regulator
MPDKIPDDVIRQALQQAAWDKRRSLHAYRAAIEQAHTQGWQHTEIARACGVTEAAIRNYLKRRGTR